MYRKILMAVLLAALTLGHAPNSHAAGPSHCIFTIPEQARMQSAFERISGVGIISPPQPGVSWDPPPNAVCWTYTRAEFSLIMVRALGLEAEATAAEITAPFTDMEHHWANKQVATLFRQGLVIGYPDSTFQPDEKITLPEVRLILARTLRLGNDLSLESAPVALAKGGIDPQVPDSQSEWALRGQVFLLLDRTLSASFYARFPQ